jgi:hypothetical protein
MKKIGLVYLFMIIGLIAFAQQTQEVSPTKASGKTNASRPQGDPNAPPARVGKLPEGYKRTRVHQQTPANGNEASPSTVKKAVK